MAIACALDTTSSDVGVEIVSSAPAVGAVEAPLRVVGRSASLRLPADARLPFELFNTRLGGSAKIRIDGARGAGQPRGDAVVYPSALGPGADLELRGRPGGVEDRIALAERPRSGRVAYEIEPGPEIAGLRVAGGVVELLLASGAPALRVGGAAIDDAHGRRHPIALDVADCPVDRASAPPWGRTPVPLGRSACTIVAELPHAVAYPAIYDPLWTATDDMVVARSGFGAVVLADGRVLAAGGFDDGSLDEVEMYDPATETWSLLGATAWLPDQIQDFPLVLLNDGRVMLPGGAWALNGTTVATTTLLFSTASLTWTPGPDMAFARYRHTATRLADGRVLVAGGNDDGFSTQSSAEVFDPTTDTWSTTGAMTVEREGHTAVAIGGRALVVGGWSDQEANPVNTSEIFDPAANAGAGDFVSLQTFTQHRAYHAIERLGTDQVVISGGMEGYAFGSTILATSVEVFDVQAEDWSTIGSAPVGTATGAARLPDGSVLFVGGCSDADTVWCDVPMQQATRVDPVTHLLSPAGTLTVPRGKHVTLSLQDGRVIVAGGELFGTAQDDTRVYDMQPNGETCAETFECLSGICVEGVCCDAACDGVCVSCLAALTGADEGTCSPVAAGTDPESECADQGAAVCGTNGLCEAGACDTYEPGECEAVGCTGGAECASGFCVDGVCCDEACDGLCEACTGALKGQGGDGVCGPIASGLDPELECSAANATCEERAVCDGASTCTPLVALCAPYACTMAGCLSVCDNDAGCQSGFVCVTGACVDEESLCTNETQALARDGTVTDCAPYRCDDDGTCRGGCVSVDDCATGFVCRAEDATCIPRPPAEGGEEGCACR